MFVHKGDALTISASFDALSADYSADVVWNLKGVEYKASSSVSGYSVISKWNGSNKIDTELRVDKWELGDQDVSVKVNRTSVNPAIAEFKVDEYGK